MRRVPMFLTAGLLLLTACGTSQTGGGAGSAAAAPTAVSGAAIVAPTVDHSTMAGMSATAMPMMSGTAVPPLMSGTAMSGTMPMGNAPYDALFIDSMLQHHQSAIAMAKQALNDATKPEIKMLAQNIIKAQEAEIKQMQDWRKAWYPNLAPTQGMGMAMGDMMVSADTTKPFDQRFMAAMIPHHQSAIMMAQDAAQKAQHAEIKQLATSIMQDQAGEIAQMQQWQKDWYHQ